MHCRNTACFQRHREISVRKRRASNRATQHSVLSDCQRYWRCLECKKVVDRKKRDVEKKPHSCGEYYCKICDSWVEPEHLCFLRANKPQTKNQNYIFLDFETSQNTNIQCTTGYTPRSGCIECTPNELCSRCKRCTSCKNTYCGQERHTPNFAIAQTACGECLLDNPVTPRSKCEFCGTKCDKCKRAKGGDNSSCTDCGLREVKFSGPDTAAHLCRWLFSAENKNATVLAHNMRSFDGIFILDYLLQQSMRPNKIIYSGCKIMYMEVQRGLNIRILDSLNFLPMKLSALPKAFDLEELQKGYFPHLFNTWGNQSYVGPYPDTQYYGADSMNREDREAFLQWHSQKLEEGAEFNFRQEIEAYCRSDVDILRQACLKFRQLMLEVTENKVDCFQHVTIASTCMAVYKTVFLEEEYLVKLEKPGGDVTKWLPATLKGGVWNVYYELNWVELQNLDGYTIKAKKFKSSPLAQVPSSGYSSKDNYSKASIEWLENLMAKSRQAGNPTSIRHALNGGEHHIPATRYRVDGYCHSTNTVYEYHGCLWHGCPVCYSNEKRAAMRHPRTHQSMEELYALTLKKKRLLKQMGYKYVCIWEHEFLQMKTQDVELRAFVDGLDVQARLDPRESFFGGRTNACKLYFSARDDERVAYVDVTSLYPYVNAYCKYPVGHPEIITSDFQDIGQYFGIAKVQVLPPRGLYHPVLPYKSRGKLKFPLCRTCADSENLVPCGHNSDERAITGTWCTPELRVAIDKGYKVLKIYEIYHWDETTCYDPAKKEGGLFVDYINTFLKLKQESSGYPDWCSTPADKVKYVSDYLSHQGILLDETNIEKNPGLRSLAKLCLNSFWGKFGQRLNLTQTEFFHDQELDKFYKVLADPQKRMTNFHIVNEHTIQLEWEYHSALVPEDTKTNIFVASFTTAHARLKLYELLDKLQERVLYFDTDSVVYWSKPGDYEPPIGDYLGDLTDELNGDYITEFVSAGPKNYAYKTSKGTQVCKIRGFTLNYANSNLLNLNTMREMVSNVDPENVHTFSRKRKATDDPNESVTAKNVVTLVNTRKICRDKTNNIVFNREEKKTYSIVYTKRVIQPDLDTLPYGF
ncbi:MAG: DNA polymerase [Sedimenticola sp.]